MKLILFALFNISIILSQSPNARADEVCKARADYDAITEGVTAKFYDPTFKGLDWSAEVARFRAQVECGDDANSVALVVNALLAELNTSHTAVYTKSELDYWALKSIFAGDLTQFAIPFVGIWPTQINGEWFARLVLQGSPAEEAGVRMGDKLISVDGQPFKPMAFVEGKMSLLEVSEDGQTTKTIGILPKMWSVQEGFLLATKLSEKIYGSNIKKTGYVHLWCGTNPEFLSAFNATLANFKDQHIDNLIVDLRDGFGGADPEYLKTLREDPYFKKIPKIFLINEGVRSGKEWVAALVKRDGLGTLIGTRTAGAFMSGGPVDVHDDEYFLYLAMKEFTPPNLPKIEGVGVSPDQVVQGCSQYCNLMDPQLEFALRNFSN